VQCAVIKNGRVIHTYKTFGWGRGKKKIICKWNRVGATLETVPPWRRGGREKIWDVKVLKNEIWKNGVFVGGGISGISIVKEGADRKLGKKNPVGGGLSKELIKEENSKIGPRTTRGN